MWTKFPYSLSRFWFVLLAAGALAQSGDDTIRVTVRMNPDGSKTVYETNGAAHQTTAITTSADGKKRGKIIYKLDDAGRYESGEVFGPDSALRMKTRYQYDSAGRLAEETQLNKNDSVRNRIVYSYDSAGHQTAYAIYDGDGRLLGRTTPKKAAAQNSAPRPR